LEHSESGHGRRTPSVGKNCNATAPKTVRFLQVNERPLSSVLPLETLRNVRDLTLHCHAYSEPEPEWPTSWGQLTAITRLSVQLENWASGRRYLLPPFVAEMGSLRDVEVTAGYSTFENSGEGYTLLVLGCLHLLTRLQVNIMAMTLAERGGGLEVLRDRLKAICMGVKLRMPEVVYSFVEVDKEASEADLCILFTFQE
jgi:hypothetical protein